MPDRLSLLFVDDDPLFLDLISVTAKDVFPSVEIVTLQNPIFASRVCAEHEFDCAILDYQMPQLDGLACAKSLRQALPYLPIVLLTGAGDEVIAAAAFQNGVTDYIPKSRLNTQALRRTIKRAIELTAQKRLIDEQRTEIEAFAYALAHDFRQPLRQMRTFANMVVDELGDDAPAGVRKHLGFVEAAATRLTNLVDTMSDYALLNRPIVLEPVNVQQVVADICISIQPFIQERHGRVIADCDATVLGNTVLLTQVLQNLIVNGLKYNNNETPTVTIKALRNRACCHLSVRDNGIGIDPSHHESIFSPLIRLHAQSEYSGTGLGLTIVRKAVTAQKGIVTCNSSLGRGAEFLLKLQCPPRKTRRPAKRAKPRAKPPMKDRKPQDGVDQTAVRHL